MSVSTFHSLESKVDGGGLGSSRASQSQVLPPIPSHISGLSDSDWPENNFEFKEGRFYLELKAARGAWVARVGVESSRPTVGK